MFLTRTLIREDKTTGIWLLDSLLPHLKLIKTISKQKKSAAPVMSVNISGLIKSFVFPFMFEFPEAGNKLDISNSRFDLTELFENQKSLIGYLQ